ncbi:hypothetical protein ACIBCA_25450 [Kitasatospora sp. NPDC051170]|uniref:hypothetical protein n=1 Tax=Kitasatospora sp. NPDC051170 TaxID=3364056 RepID=UPI0037A3DC4C
MGWFEQAEEAEQAQDWDTAIALVSARAECFSVDHYAHDHHLRHMSLLARAGRFVELAELGRTDVHARRKLNAELRARGMDAALRTRAEDGDRSAQLNLLRLLRETGRAQEADQFLAEHGAEE